MSSDYTLGINPTTDGTGTHDPGAVIFHGADPVFGAEEERYTRNKGAVQSFPTNAVEACLDYCDITLGKVDRVVVGWEPKKASRHDIVDSLKRPSLKQKAFYSVRSGLKYGSAHVQVRNRLSAIGEPVPEVVYRTHHLSHAASAFHTSGFEEALVVTIDGRGEQEATVVWRGAPDRMERLRTYELPNSWGRLYSMVTEFLGYRPNNGEGKVMGLAAYGDRNPEIEEALRSTVTTGVDYDLGRLKRGWVDRLEDLLGRSRVESSREFTEWEQDLAHVTQALLEETVTEIIDVYAARESLSSVCYAGGVALNCKMNNCVMELESVDELFVQPVAHDAGVALGAGLVDTRPELVSELTDVYLGPRYSMAEIRSCLNEYKLEYREPDDLEQKIAERLADGSLVGWFQGRMELGPRALGNRSIIADSRSVDSRDRINEFVKHREDWRPFAPSLLEEAASEYLQNPEPAPFMIKTFDVVEEKKDEIPAVLHPGDETTRPQTVNEDQNPRYYRLIEEFADITGVPVVLNTSFNDHGEPIVRTPTQALKDFYGMGLDILVLEDAVLTKPGVEPVS